MKKLLSLNCFSLVFIFSFFYSNNAYSKSDDDNVPTVAALRPQTRLFKVLTISFVKTPPFESMYVCTALPRPFVSFQTIEFIKFFLFS